MPDSTEPSVPIRCGPGRLILVMVYDLVIICGLLIVAAALVSPFDQGNQRAMQDLPFTLYLAVVWFLYLAVSWRRARMTLGMRAWGVELRTVQGSTPGWGQCLLRFVAGCLALGLAGMGLFWMLWERQGRSWQDLASNTGLFRRDAENS